MRIAMLSCNTSHNGCNLHQLNTWSVNTQYSSLSGTANPRPLVSLLPTAQPFFTGPHIHSPKAPTKPLSEPCWSCSDLTGGKRRAKATGPYWTHYSPPSTKPSDQLPRYKSHCSCKGWLAAMSVKWNRISITLLIMSLMWDTNPTDSSWYERQLRVQRI